MIERPDLRSPAGPAGLEVYQLTAEALPSSHIYMEAQIFTPDATRFLLHRSAHPHGSDPRDPEHRYLLCDLQDGGRLCPVTSELGATAPSIAPDGATLYYFVDQTEPGRGGRLTLRRVDLDGSGRRDVAVVDGPVPGTGLRPSRPYPLSTVRADGRRVALSCYLGDLEAGRVDWGLLVFDVDTGGVDLVLQGPSWCNVHPQYCRSADPAALRDLLVQENHGNECDASGQFTRLVGGAGADIHVIRDDGTDLRDLPWGRDGNEHCQGHQCWIGATTTALTSTAKRQPPEWALIAGRPVPHVGHEGLKTPGAWRSDLSRTFAHPDFHHFATDAAGRWLICDAGPRDRGGCLYRMRLPEVDGQPIREYTYLTSPRSSWAKDTHVHPFLAPDGGCAFFNSDESGTLQAYMVRGW